MGAIYLLSLRQMSGRWRLLIMTILATMPVIMAVVTLQSARAPSVRDFESVVLSGMLAGAIGPLIVLAIATAAFANEIEDRTLANLTLTPIPRWRIALPKLLATITLAAPFIAISAFVTSEIAFLGDTSAAVAVTVSALIAVTLYAAAFVWLGLVTTQAIGLGLLYIVLWEGFFSGYVSGVRLLSIRHHSIALMHAIDPRRFAGGSHPAPVIVIAASVLLFAGFLLLSVRRLRRMDVP
jgi:ABC-type transport system involved in multi-copper enzyme maturation permease subunit